VLLASRRFRPTGRPLIVATPVKVPIASIALAFALSGSVGPAAAGPAASSATLQRGNLWVDVNGGSCARAARPVAYRDARACGWAQANRICAGGDVVRVKGGAYGRVKIRGSNGRTRPCTVRTARGELVTAGEFNLGDWQDCRSGPNSASTTNQLTLTGPIRTTQFHADCSDRVTVDRLDMDAGGQRITQPFHVGAGVHDGDNVTNFTLRNSRVHNAYNSGAMMWLGTPGRNIVLDHNEIYDDINDTDGVVHDECIRASDLSNFRFTRNHMWSCNVMDLFFGEGQLASNVIIENNVFEGPTGSEGNSHNAIYFGSPAPDNVSIRYNTFGSTGVTVIRDPTARGMTVVGNYFDVNSPCREPNTVYAFNVTPLGVSNCGGRGARSFSSAALHHGFVRYRPFTGNGGSRAEASGDYRLRRGSPLINRGNRASYPRRDRNGVKRYRGHAPDIGAFESRY